LVTSFLKTLPLHYVSKTILFLLPAEKTVAVIYTLQKNFEAKLSLTTAGCRVKRLERLPNADYFSVNGPRRET